MNGNEARCRRHGGVLRILLLYEYDLCSPFAARRNTFSPYSRNDRHLKQASTREGLREAR